MRVLIVLVSWLAAFFFLLLQVQASFESDILDLHNKYRKKHGCPELVLDSSLNNDCEKYAEELAAANTLKHSDGPYGENLCYTTACPLTCVRDWYDEIKDYDFDKGIFSPGTGHFTQLVWKNSTILGVGKHKNSDRKTFVVARYKPAGNIAGAFLNNVPRPNRSGNMQDSSKYLILFTWIFTLLLTKGFFNSVDDIGRANRNV